jgi:hypothetical protein
MTIKPIEGLTDNQILLASELASELGLSEIPTKDQIDQLLKKANDDYDYFNAVQLALKLALNGSYGAFIEKSFACFNADIGNSITDMGRTIIQYCHAVSSDYWENTWHLDTELHEKLGVDSSKVKKIEDGSEITAYGDTDSVSKDTYIESSTYGRIKIEDYYKLILENKGNESGSIYGHRWVYPDDMVLSYCPNDKHSHYVHANRLIKHKVTKKMYKITTISGESVTVTEDHSIVVYRKHYNPDGSEYKVFMEIKPTEINRETDEIVVIK